jgi:V-type H+-transporting ATPase subunit a
LLNYVAGVIPSGKVAVFQRVLYRATRGNCHARFAEIPEPLVDPATAETVEKSVFMLFFSGSAVKSKVEKICGAFDATRYPFPEDDSAQLKAAAECEERLGDLGAVIDTTAAARTGSLRDVAGSLPVWVDKVVREKAIYHTLNMLNYDTSNALFIAEVWTPTFALADVNAALHVGRRRSHAQVPSILETRPVTHDLTPPTHFKINKFTQVFQDIVESYGVAEYHEVNPAPFTVITFPFLFAVMFGDIGHGFIMAAFSAYVVLNEKRMNRRKLGEFMTTVYDGRYMLLLMGLFSIFTGALYNEFFAVPLNLFGSRWQYTEASSMACGIDNCDIPGAVLAPKSPYPFGFDPIWKGSQTGLVFFNSYKMKLSIVLGVCQMVMGICMSYYNATFHRKPLDVWYVFVPQMVFMNAIFGYLVILILMKWSINWDSPTCRADPNCIAPDLKNVLIQMFMAPGTVPALGQMYPGQAFVQVVLLLAALIAVPWMLFPKPLILKARFEKKMKDAYRPVMDEHESTELLGSNGGSAITDMHDAVGEAGGYDEDEDVDDDFNFGEMFVNQMIHTIEFVLGAVSNTASYLRLWALRFVSVFPFLSKY